MWVSLKLVVVDAEARDHPENKVPRAKGLGAARKATGDWQPSTFFIFFPHRCLSTVSQLFMATRRSSRRTATGANKYVALASDGDHSQDEHVPEADDSHDD